MADRRAKKTPLSNKQKKQLAKDTPPPTQKQLAQSGGGKFRDRETGDIVQVNPTGGRAISLTINENLAIGDTVSGTRITRRPDVGITKTTRFSSAPTITKQTKTQGAPVEAITKQNKKGGRDLSLTLNEKVAFNDPSSSKGAAAPFGPSFIAGATALFGGGTSGFRTEVKRNVNVPEENRDILNELKENVIGVSEELRNFALEGFQAEISRGPGVIATSGGQAVAVDPTVKELHEQAEALKIPDTFTEKISEGRFEDIDINDPRTAGQISSIPLLALGPKTGGESLVSVGSKLAVKQSKAAVVAVNKFFKEAGDTLGFQRIFVPVEKTVIGPLLPKDPKVINPLTGKAYKFSKTIKEEPPLTGKDIFISTGGTEEAPTALRILKTGKPDPVFGPKLKDPVKEVTPTGEQRPTLTPDEINIKGQLGPIAKAGLDVKQVGGFQFTSRGKPSAFSKKVFSTGIQKGQGVEVAKGETAPLSAILEGNIGQFTRGKTVTKVTTLTPKEGTATLPGKAKELDTLNLGPYKIVIDKTANEPLIISGLGKQTKLGSLVGPPTKGSQVIKLTEDVKIPPTKKSQSVFVQTKAEKIIPDFIGPKQPRPFKKPSSPFPTDAFETSKGIAGGTGKAKSVFSKPQAAEIRQTEVTKAINELRQRDMDILFKGPRFSGKLGGAAPQITTTRNEFSTPPQNTKLNFQDEIQTQLNPKRDKQISAGITGISFSDSVSIKKSQKQQQGLVSGLQFRDNVITTKTTSTPRLTESLRIKEGFDFKLTPGTGIFPDPELPPPPPPFVPGPDPKLPPPVFGGVPVGISLSQFASGGKARTSKRFIGFGISSDITIKNLGFSSKVGRSSKVFTTVRKADAKLQEQLFGKPKRKKSKSKKSKSKRGKKR